MPKIKFINCPIIEPGEEYENDNIIPGSASQSFSGRYTPEKVSDKKVAQKKKIQDFLKKTLEKDSCKYYLAKIIKFI